PDAARGKDRKIQMNLTCMVTCSIPPSCGGILDEEIRDRGRVRPPPLPTFIYAAEIHSEEGAFMGKSLKGVIIHPLLAFQDFPDDGFISFVNNVCAGLDGNPALGKPPVPIIDVRSLRDAFSAAKVVSADGSRTATADKNKKREQLTVMMR